MTKSIRKIELTPTWSPKSLTLRRTDGLSLITDIVSAPRKRIVVDFARRQEPKDTSEVLFLASSADDKLNSGTDSEGAANPPWLPASMIILAVEPRSQREPSNSANMDISTLEFRALDASCPHAGAALDLGDIEDIVAYGPDDKPNGTDTVILCPLHLFDFSLKTGKSSISITKASVYSVAVKEDGKALEIGELWWGEQGRLASVYWDVSAREVEAREFCEEAVAAKCGDLKSIEVTTEPAKDGSAEQQLNASMDALSLNQVPESLLAHLQQILNTPNLTEKAKKIRALKKRFDAGEIPLGPRDAYRPPDVPPREADVLFVDPKRVRKRGFGSLAGRLGMLHALANIEGWAMDLGLDIMVRFAATSVSGNYPVSSEDDYVPRQYFSDFLKLADDEAKHFTLLSERLEEMDSPFPSKDYPCHLGLWDSASATSQDLLDRLAVVHMVHEARGLDVNPETIIKFSKAGDAESAAMLTIIHEDEITHVGCGVKWFEYICKERQWDPVETFKGIIDRQRNGRIKPPWNEKDRARAGMDRAYYADYAD